MGVPSPRLHIDTTLRAPNEPRATLLIGHTLAKNLLELYDVPHPLRPERVIVGYDKPHALRTAKLCVAVAQALGYSRSRLEQFQIACLLHDLGRAGLDQRLFGKIWSWAKHHGIPTRPREWREAYPDTPPGRETQAFLRRFGPSLEKAGIQMDWWAREQVDMRLGFARRLRRHLRAAKPTLRAWGVEWAPWMERIMLYYYYPEKLERSPIWIHRLAEILVACEQLEAYCNARRGRDYYTRKSESLQAAFEYLNRLYHEGIISHVVLATMYTLTLHGVFDAILASARGRAFENTEHRQLASLAQHVLSCP